MELILVGCFKLVFCFNIGLGSACVDFFSRGEEGWAFSLDLLSDALLDAVTDLLLPATEYFIFM